MMSDNHTFATTFWNFLKDNTIEIPIIQRDYAQGRCGKENLRKIFLRDLKKALDNVPPYKDAKMKLDFVYGSTENGRLNPLDGQQRLTTLWLLHWYIALRAGMLNDDNCSILRNFTYEIRTSSREFCQNLCTPQYFKSYDENDIVAYIKKQTWFYSVWMQDPTIQSMLTMLGGDTNDKNLMDGIEKFFKDSFPKYWECLTVQERIVFYYVPLKDFGLSDDLYIKMNARGKQLTSFENFKADLIGYIKKQAETDEIDEKQRRYWQELNSPKNGISIKLDTDWTDIFWKNRSIGIKNNAGKQMRSNQIDEIFFAFFNRFFWNELFIAKKSDSNSDYILYVGQDDKTSGVENKNASYSYLNDSNNPNDGDTKISYQELDVYKYNNGIPVNFFMKLQNVFGNYYQFAIKDSKILPYCPWNLDFHFIPQYIEDAYHNNIEIVNNAKNIILKVSALNQVHRIVFFAICKYFDHKEMIVDDEITLKQWLRVVWNLVSGEDNNGRAQIRSAQAVRTAIEFIDKLDCHNVYKSLKEYNGGLSDSEFDKRCKEEIDKAKQIVNEEGGLRVYDGTHKKDDGSNYQTWEEIIIEAEKYAFFKGAIRFLFTDGKNIKWIDFDIKWNNVKSLIPENKGNRSTIKTIISFYNDDDVKELFSQVTLSNYDTNLRLLLLSFPSKVHEILKNPENKSETSLLKEHLILLCEQCPDYWLHLDWGSENEFVILSNYEKRGGYYQYGSYIVGSNFFPNRLNLLNQFLENKIDVSMVWKGLFIEFEYKNHKFRWQWNDWVDMYDDHMNNLWKNGLNSNYNGNKQHSFKDAETLKNELDRCIKEYKDLQS